jgi:Caspase domain
VIQSVLFRICFIALAALLTLLSPAWAQKKVALVIGNGAYLNATELPNPPNDARDMEGVLTVMGFEVVSVFNATKQDMDSKIREFAEKADSADVALFFYAGHGMQVNGANYLIPIDAKLETSTALDFETVNSESVIRYMSSDTRIGLVFLDACRDNPLSRRFQKKSRSAAVGSGLATRTGSDPNLMITFATSPGEVALDGNGRNSPFTAALIKYLPQPKKELKSVMTDVKADVQNSTGKEQIPWSHDNLVTNLFLMSPPDDTAQPVLLVTPPKLDDTPPPPPASDEARDAWETVKDLTSPAAFDAVAKRYPGTLYAELATARAQELRDDTKRKAIERAEAKRQADLEAKKKRQQARLETEKTDDDPPPKPKPSAGNLTWGVILGSFQKNEASKARSRLKAARANGMDARLIDTDNYGKLTPGLYAVVVAVESRSTALSLAAEAQSVFGDAYASQLQ